jgi:hypothetical protein
MLRSAKRSKIEVVVPEEEDTVPIIIIIINK